MMSQQPFHSSTSATGTAEEGASLSHASVVRKRSAHAVISMTNCKKISWTLEKRLLQRLRLSMSKQPHLDLQVLLVSPASMEKIHQALKAHQVRMAMLVSQDQMDVMGPMAQQE